MCPVGGPAAATTSLRYGPMGALLGRLSVRGTVADLWGASMKLFRAGITQLTGTARPDPLESRSIRIWYRAGVLPVFSTYADGSM